MNGDTTETQTGEVTHEEQLRDQSSMRYWWPRLSEVDVRTPETVCVEATDQEVDLGVLPNGERDYMRCHYPDDMDEIRAAVKAVDGPPAFIRTDQASNKHQMEDGSRIESLDEVEGNVWSVVEHNLMAGLGGLPYDRFYVREWLDLYHEYTAFRETPIAAELRFFIHENQIHDYGFYWPEDAVRRPDSDEWETLHEMTRETAFEHLEAAESHAQKVAEKFDGYWSVDFALTFEKDWYCIDMARGEVSWHPDGCEKPESLQERGIDV